MGLIPFVPDSSLYDDILSNNQVGNGALGRYRGSLYQNGAGLGSFFRSMFSRFSRFAAPLVRTALPHVKTAMESAKPHLSTAARSVMNEAGKNIAQKIASAITPRTDVDSAEQGGAGTGTSFLLPHPVRARGYRRSAYPHRTKRLSGAVRGRHKRSAVRLQRIPPYNLPDSF